MVALADDDCKLLLTNMREEFTCSKFTDKSEWIHLPCKVGDVVYQVTRNFISEFRVRFVEIATCGNLFLHTDLISGIVYTGEVFSESDIGKQYFSLVKKPRKHLRKGELQILKNDILTVSVMLLIDKIYHAIGIKHHTVQND